MVETTLCRSLMSNTKTVNMNAENVFPKCCATLVDIVCQSDCFPEASFHRRNSKNRKTDFMYACGLIETAC